MDRELLSRMIGELVVNHDRVGLPGVGTFVAEVVPASFSDKGYTINPPYRRLTFHSSISEDRLLVNFYSEKNNVPEDISREYISQFLAGLKEVLQERKSVVLPGLGRLRATRENTFFFVPDADLDIFPEAFALKPVSLKSHPLIDEQVEIPFKFQAPVEVPAPVSDTVTDLAHESDPDPATLEPVANPVPDTDPDPALESVADTDAEPLVESESVEKSAEAEVIAEEDIPAEVEVAEDAPTMAESVSDDESSEEEPVIGLSEETDSIEAEPEQEESAIELETEPEPEIEPEPELVPEIASETESEPEPEERRYDFEYEETEEESVPKKTFRWWVLVLVLLAVAAVALAAFVIVARLAPDFMDTILYTPEELRIINY